MRQYRETMEHPCATMLNASPGRRHQVRSYAREQSWVPGYPSLATDVRPARAMRDVRQALIQLDQQGLDLWDGRSGASPLFVDRAGHIIIVTESAALDTHGQGVVSDWLDLLAPFVGADGAHAPDLRTPREHLRIVPGKCAGEPHVAGSRLTTMTIAALAERGYDVDDVVRLYPDESRESIAEAIDLERSLGTLDRAA